MSLTLTYFQGHRGQLFKMWFLDDVLLQNAVRITKPGQIIDFDLHVFCKVTEVISMKVVLHDNYREISRE